MNSFIGSILFVLGSFINLMSLKWDETGLGLLGQILLQKFVG